jgi:colanic acid/amylovoran biosynthesis glycosyltransferase
MKIVHVAESFSPLSETFIYDYISGLRSMGIECPVVTLSLVPTAGRTLGEVAEIRRPHRFECERLWHRFRAQLGVGRKSTASWPSLRRRMRSRLQELQPDVVHAHFGSMGALVYPVARDLKVPLVVSFHGVDAFSYPLREPFKSAYPEMMSHADAMTVVSQVMQEHLISLGADKFRVHVIRVGKRPSDYPQAANGERPIRNWVSVGRLVEKKGHLDALEAFRRVAGSHPEQRLRIVGDGPLREKMAAFIREHDLTDRIELVGSLAHDEVIELLQDSDAFLLCSRTGPDGDMEGVPTVLMEAQLIGLPCVSTLHSGIPEVIPAENQWLLAPEGDVDRLAEAMHLLIHSAPAKLADIRARAYKKVEQDFNLDVVLHRLVRLYEATVSVKSPPPREHV